MSIQAIANQAELSLLVTNPNQRQGYVEDLILRDYTIGEISEISGLTISYLMDNYKWNTHKHIVSTSDIIDFIFLTCDKSPEETQRILRAQGIKVSLQEINTYTIIGELQ